jgi:hypothetical protein
MLDVKEAAHRASDYFLSLYGGEGSSGVRLEEVELTDDGRYWLITLSHPIRDDAPWELATRREYKLFTIDATTGEVKSMKIRKVG